MEAGSYGQALCNWGQLAVLEAHKQACPGRTSVVTIVVDQPRPLGDVLETVRQMSLEYPALRTQILGWPVSPVQVVSETSPRIIKCTSLPPAQYLTSLERLATDDPTHIYLETDGHLVRRQRWQIPRVVIDGYSARRLKRSLSQDQTLYSQTSFARASQEQMGTLQRRSQKAITYMNTLLYSADLKTPSNTRVFESVFCDSAVLPQATSAIAKVLHCSESAVLMAAFASVMSVWINDGKKLLFYSECSNRTAKTELFMGSLSQTALVQVPAITGITFTEMCHAVQRASLTAYAHSMYDPVDWSHRQGNPRSNLIPLLFNDLRRTVSGGSPGLAATQVAFADDLGLRVNGDRYTDVYMECTSKPTGTRLNLRYLESFGKTGLAALFLMERLVVFTAAGRDIPLDKLHELLAKTDQTLDGRTSAVENDLHHASAFYCSLANRKGIHNG